MEKGQNKRTIFFSPSGKNAAHLNEEAACLNGYHMEVDHMDLAEGIDSFIPSGNLYLTAMPKS